MTTFLKVISWLKSHWYIIFVILAAAALFLIGRKGTVDWRRILDAADDAHQKEVEAIDTAHAEQMEESSKAIRRANEARKQVISEFIKNDRAISAKEKKEIERILKKRKDDPEAIRDELEKLTGYRVTIVS